MDKRQRDHDWSGPGTYISENINRTALQDREDQLKMVEELCKSLEHDIWIIGYENNGQKIYEESLEKLQKLNNMCIQAIKAQK